MTTEESAKNFDQDIEMIS
uniref:Uncharacterized protein n=1 Tax=Rhizophora mucronata TaxID=61149 RepID=A0A2P2QY40_RHIMU